MKTLKNTFAAIAILAATAGCSTTSMTAAQTPAPQTASVTANLAISGPGGYRVQTLTAWNLSNVDHVNLTLYKSVSGSFVATGATKTIANASLSSAVTLSNLDMATTYKVVASAFADAAGTQEIDDIAQSGSDALCSTTFVTPSLVASGSGNNVDNSTQAITVPIQLENKTFAGQATSGSGVAVTNGTIVNTTAAETF